MATRRRKKSEETDTPEATETSEAAEAEAPTRTRRRRTRRKDEEAQAEERPTRTRRRRTQAKEEEAQDAAGSAPEQEEAPKRTRRRRRKSDEESAASEEETSTGRRRTRRRRKSDEEPVEARAEEAEAQEAAVEAEAEEAEAEEAEAPQAPEKEEKPKRTRRASAPKSGGQSPRGKTPAALSKAGRVWVEELLGVMGHEDVTVKGKYNKEDQTIYYAIGGEGRRALLGSSGRSPRVLEGIERILSDYLRLRDSNYKVHLDVDEFRVKHTARLQQVAQGLAQHAQKTGSSLLVAGLNDFERRVVHNAVDDAPVHTESEGNGSFRKLRITPS